MQEAKEGVKCPSLLVLGKNNLSGGGAWNNIGKDEALEGGHGQFIPTATFHLGSLTNSGHS